MEARVGQAEIAAIALDSGELCARHRRFFAKHLTLTYPGHLALSPSAERDAEAGGSMGVV